MDVYLIYPKTDGILPEEIHVIKANSFSEARLKALDLYSRDDMFLQYVLDISLGGFVSEFYEDKDGYFLDEYGFYVERLANMFSRDLNKLEEYVDINVELNLRKFFGAMEEFAEVLIEPFLKKEKIAKHVSYEMCRYIMDKQNFGYLDGINIKRVDFDE